MNDSCKGVVSRPRIVRDPENVLAKMLTRDLITVGSAGNQKRIHFLHDRFEGKGNATAHDTQEKIHSLFFMELPSHPYADCRPYLSVSDQNLHLPSQDAALLFVDHFCCQQSPLG